MRIDHVEVSTHPPDGWGPDTDAPTYLPTDEIVIAVRKQAQSDSVITSAPRNKRPRERRETEARRPSQTTLLPNTFPPSNAPAYQTPSHAHRARERYSEPTPPTREVQYTPSQGQPARKAQHTPPDAQRERQYSPSHEQPAQHAARPAQRERQYSPSHEQPAQHAPQPAQRYSEPTPPTHKVQYTPSHGQPAHHAPQPAHARGSEPVAPAPAPQAKRPSAPHRAQPTPGSQPAPLPAPPPAGEHALALPPQLAAHIAQMPPEMQAQFLGQLQALPPEARAQVIAQLVAAAQQAAAQGPQPPQPHVTPPQPTPASQAQPSHAPHSRSTQQPQPEAVSRPSQAAADPSYREIPGFIPFEGGASFDPLAIPLPPELAGPVYNWLRRLALQADLPGADRLLREAYADLTNALSVLILYADGDGLHSLGANDELPKDPQPIIQVAKARRALVGTHTALIPITTTTETIAVIQLARNARQPEFNMVDHVTMAALARESAAIMHHLVVEHLQKRVEQEADKRSLYRAEALESHRNKGQEGVVTELSPGWVRATYWVLGVSMAVAIAFAGIITVPTYSTGQSIIYFPGARITAPAPGQVAEIRVVLGSEVHKGDLLVRLSSAEQEANLEQANRALEAAIIQHLVDMNDEGVRKGLVDAQGQAKRAQDAVDQRKIYAPVDGTVEEIPVQVNSAVQFGDPVVTVVAPDAQPEVWAFQPGPDAPRLKKGMTIQLELANFQKAREKVKIEFIEQSLISGSQAKKSLGLTLGDGLKLPPDGNFVLVKGKLKKRQFRAKGKTYYFHHGMPAKSEVKVESKRFIVTLLPSLEKYIE